MGVFQILENQGEHELVLFCNDKSVGLKAIIAIHNTSLGPALGGTRMWNYKNEDEALVDVLRLSKGMTYKAAVSGLNLGGGKAVIIGDPKKDKSEGLFRAFGQFVNSLNGKYITAEDVGTKEQDMEYIYMETPYVTGIPKEIGGSGDPSPYTAHGVFMGIKAAALEKFGSEDLRGRHICIQGLGNVGFHLLKYLLDAGARCTIADIDSDKIQAAKKLNPELMVSSPSDIVTTECDILAPCALGGVVSDETLPKLKCKVIAGGANNQLAESRHGYLLQERGILYAPDYVINAGGLMNVFVELEGYSSERVLEKTKKVFTNLQKVFELAKSAGVPPHIAADRVAEERIRTIGHLRERHPGKSQRNFTTLKEVFNR